MKIVIVGCGRVGSTLAENFDAEGHEVIIFDVKTAAFDRLPETFKGAAIRGDGTDEEVLRQAGAQGADIFLSLTEGDNRNIMAAQVATESFGIQQVIAKINDPVRAAAYSDLGVVTLCRTNLMVDSVAQFLDLPMQTGPGIDIPDTPGREHPHPSAETIEVPVHIPDALRGRGTADAASPSDSSPSPRKVTTDAADSARPPRAGFRRWRG